MGDGRRQKGECSVTKDNCYVYQKEGEITYCNNDILFFQWEIYGQGKLQK
jgi:hypothetical protein